MAILTVGIDLAKNVFAVHGIDDAGKPALVRPTVARDKLHELIAALPPCVHRHGGPLRCPSERITVEIRRGTTGVSASVPMNARSAAWLRDVLA